MYPLPSWFFVLFMLFVGHLFGRCLSGTNLRLILSWYTQSRDFDSLTVLQRLFMKILATFLVALICFALTACTLTPTLVTTEATTEATIEATTEATTEATAVAAAPAATSEAAAPGSAAFDAPTALREAVSADKILAHLETMQAIADEHSGTRASGTAGYDAAAAWLIGELEAAGYTVTTQPFGFDGRFFGPTTQLRFNSETRLPRDLADDYQLMTYSGGGETEATVQPVDVLFDLSTETDDESTSGCEAEDFASFAAGSVALVERGTCPFGDKVQNAVDAGAVGVLIFNQAGSSGTPRGSLGGFVNGPEISGLEDNNTGSETPVLGLGRELGLALVERVGDGETVTAVIDVRRTMNIIAESPGGDSDNVVMLGAHFDSVPFGPGINDNGSGTALLLTLAQELALLEQPPTQKVRFAFWGAEEIGLVGSSLYVGDLALREPEALEEISLYLNFDMVGSPNYQRAVYTLPNFGDGEANDEITELFSDYLDEQGLAWQPVAIANRSDHGPFLAENVPSGGLFAGANGQISEAEAERFPEAEAGEEWDPCYHQACDTIDNVSPRALEELGDAAAHALGLLAFGEQ